MFLRKSSLIIIILFILDSRMINRTEVTSAAPIFHKDSIVIKKIKLVAELKKENTLEEGLEIHQISYAKNMPLVIMGHSGVGTNVYFNDLDKLLVNDEIIIYKNNTGMHYLIEKIYDHNKGQKLQIKPENSALYLITCDKYNMKKQLIIYAKVANLSKIATFFNFF